MNDEIIDGILVTGQSNAGYYHGEPGGPKLKVFTDAKSLLMLAGKAGGSVGGDVGDTFAPADFAPFIEPTGHGQSPAGMLGLAILHMSKAFGRSDRPLALHTSFRGDTDLTSMLPDGPFNIHENSRNALLAMSEAAETHNARFELRMVDMIQGEGGPFTGYADTLRRYLSEAFPPLGPSTGLGPRPCFMFSQVNSFTTATEANPVVQDQLDVAYEFHGCGVILAGPMYQFPFYDPGHIIDYGRMMHGEVRAAAYHHVITCGGIWNPLWPASQKISRFGTQILIPFVLPPDSTELFWDEDWIAPVPDKGFSFVQSGGEPVEIASIELLGSSVLIELSGIPTGIDQRIEYALYNDPGCFGWASGRGQLYAKSERAPPVFAPLGFPVPSTVRHYSVCFRLPVIGA